MSELSRSPFAWTLCSRAPLLSIFPPWFPRLETGGMVITPRVMEWQREDMSPRHPQLAVGTQIDADEKKESGRGVPRSNIRLRISFSQI
jgi:hypothetical protein